MLLPRRQFMTVIIFTNGWIERSVRNIGEEILLKMSEPCDRNPPKEPANWILQHPTVSRAPGVAFRCLVINRTINPCLSISSWRLWRLMTVSSDMQLSSCTWICLRVSVPLILHLWSNHTSSQLCWINPLRHFHLYFFPLQIAFRQTVKYTYFMKLYT